MIYLFRKCVDKFSYPRNFFLMIQFLPLLFRNRMKHNLCCLLITISRFLHDAKTIKNNGGQ